MLLFEKCAFLYLAFCVAHFLAHFNGKFFEQVRVIVLLYFFFFCTVWMKVLKQAVSSKEM